MLIVGSPACVCVCVCLRFFSPLTLASSFSLDVFSESRVTEPTTKCILFQFYRWRAREKHRHYSVSRRRRCLDITQLMFVWAGEQTTRTEKKFFLLSRRANSGLIRASEASLSSFHLSAEHCVRLFFPRTSLPRDALRRLTSNLCLSSFICVCCYETSSSLSLSLSMLFARSRLFNLHLSLLFFSSLFCCVGECWVVVCSRPFLRLASRRRRRRLSIEHTYAHT